MTSRALAAALLCAALPGAMAAQSRDTTVISADYSAGALHRALFGDGWRDAWTTPVTVPVLDLATWGGGLEFEKRGGGNQSMVLHLKSKDGKEYRFRSVNKFPTQGYPVFRGTAFGKLLQDQISIYVPAGALMVPRLLGSIDALAVEPKLYVLRDSPQLGALNDTVSGMLGMLELKGEEGPEDTPGFAGSTKIKGTEGFLEDLASSREHQLDEREFLAVRLLDMMLNDPDRTPDNFDWARFGDKGAYTWRPVARDRDQAFIDARGLVNSLIVKRIWPKQMPFDERYRLSGLTYSTHSLDRRLLQRLTAGDVRDIALRVQRAVTDDVIAGAIAELPPEVRARTTTDERLASTLRARRERLPEFAMEFYRWLATEVDVHGTAEADRIDVMRHADGRVTVTVGDPVPAPVIARRDDGAVVTTSAGEVARTPTPYFQRTFLPHETNEIRVYADSGNDVAVVRGAASNDIVVRLIGGKGDDVLADSAGGGRTALYDAEGDNRFIPASGTRIDVKAWKPLKEVVGFRGGTEWAPDWGARSGFEPAFDYNTGAGLIVGGGPRWKSYGFRRLPYHWRAGANLLYGTANGRLGANGFAEVFAENAPRAFRLEGRATRLESSRFFGYGNDSPNIARDLNLVEQSEFIVEPSLVRFIGWRAREDDPSPVHGTDTLRYSRIRPLVGEIRVGGVFGWIDPEPVAGSPLLAPGVAGASEFALAGAQVGLELDRTDDGAVPTSGWTLKANAQAYPQLSGLDGAFGTAMARGTMYLPLGARGGPHIALRAGGSLSSGAYPAQFASAIGGRSSLRGYSYHRFAGDAAVNGGAEVRMPVGTVNLFVRSQLGVFALADAGRVWFDGESPGRWHTGVGGGVWLAAFGKAVSLAYAQGETGKLYVRYGLSY